MIDKTLAFFFGSMMSTTKRLTFASLILFSSILLKVIITYKNNKKLTTMSEHYLGLKTHKSISNSYLKITTHLSLYKFTYSVLSNDNYALFGGSDEDRTRYLIVANDALSQVSYGPIAFLIININR